MNEAASSGTDPAAVRRAVVEFIVADLAPHLAADSLSDDVNLIEDGVIDSLGVYSLVTFIEAQYAVQIDLEDLRPENFETLPAITGLVTTTVQRGSGA